VKGEVDVLVALRVGFGTPAGLGKMPSKPLFSLVKPDIESQPSVSQ